MRRGPIVTLLPLLLALAAAPATAQSIPREDALWARTAIDPITLDGVLDEPGWAVAESVIVDYGVDAGIPGSGWKQEAGLLIMNDQTHAVLKFLVRDNQLYLGARIDDRSIGGSMNFNRFDGLLMALKNHAAAGAPKPPAEYMYAWWYEDSIDPQPPGQDPAFIGMWAERPPGSPRTPEQIAAWDAVTIVDGLSNDDSSDDTGYTVEMRFDLGVMGYDVSAPEGDIVEWNVSIYDCDWYWPFDALQFYSNRVWYQCPWGNDDWYDEVRIFGRPDVTTASGPVPPIAPEMYIPNIRANPTIDGHLDEPVWSDPQVQTLDIRYDDQTLRESYPGVGQYRAGQYQPEINGGLAFVADPGDATVKFFQSGDALYFGFDVRDEVVQYVADLSRWDGFLLSLNERQERGPDNNLLGRRMSFQVAQDGTAAAQDYLLTLVTEGSAELALALKPNTTVDTTGIDVDEGYTAELKIDLTAMGYERGSLGGPLFLGINLLDGDSYTPYTDSYGTRTWWYREYENECCPIWAELTGQIVGVDDDWVRGTWGRAMTLPNPSLRPMIRYWLPERSEVTLEVYDLRGRLVSRQALGAHAAGQWDTPLFPRSQDAAGVYVYRMRLDDPRTGRTRSTLTGKVTVLK